MLLLVELRTFDVVVGSVRSASLCDVGEVYTCASIAYPPRNQSFLPCGVVKGSRRHGFALPLFMYNLAGDEVRAEYALCVRKYVVEELCFQPKEF